MTNALSNTKTGLDTLTESQMTDIAYALNAIEPGAGEHDYAASEGINILQAFSGFEWGFLAFIFCVVCILSVPSCRMQMRMVLRSLYKAFFARVAVFQKN